MRTETTSAYGAQGRDAMLEARGALPRLMRQWFADSGACVPNQCGDPAVGTEQNCGRVGSRALAER